MKVDFDASIEQTTTYSNLAAVLQDNGPDKASGSAISRINSQEDKELIAAKQKIYEFISILDTLYARKNSYFPLIMKTMGLYLYYGIEDESITIKFPQLALGQNICAALDILKAAYSMINTDCDLFNWFNSFFIYFKNMNLHWDFEIPNSNHHIISRKSQKEIVKDSLIYFYNEYGYDELYDFLSVTLTMLSLNFLGIYNEKYNLTVNRASGKYLEKKALEFNSDTARIFDSLINKSRNIRFEPESVKNSKKKRRGEVSWSNKPSSSEASDLNADQEIIQEDSVTVTTHLIQRKPEEFLITHWSLDWAIEVTFNECNDLMCNYIYELERELNVKYVFILNKDEITNQWSLNFKNEDGDYKVVSLASIKLLNKLSPEMTYFDLPVSDQQKINQFLSRILEVYERLVIEFNLPAMKKIGKPYGTSKQIDGKLPNDCPDLCLPNGMISDWIKFKNRDNYDPLLSFQEWLDDEDYTLTDDGRIRTAMRI